MRFLSNIVLTSIFVLLSLPDSAMLSNTEPTNLELMRKEEWFLWDEEIKQLFRNASISQAKYNAEGPLMNATERYSMLTALLGEVAEGADVRPPFYSNFGYVDYYGGGV